MHELLDRSCLAFEFFDERVAEHHALKAVPRLHREAAAIARRLFDFYQRVGRESVRRCP